MLKKSIAAISVIALLAGCSGNKVATTATATPEATAEAEKTMAYFEATYTGDTAPGTVIDQNSPFTITEYYQDGSSKEVDGGYEVLKGCTLEEGKSGRVDIRYNSKIATFYVESK